jgi:hypothetical protein
MMRPSLIGAAALILMASLTSGCSEYDYLQRTDRIGFRAGNAVKANLERETSNPSSRTMYDTFDLGKNGWVVPADSYQATGPAVTTPSPAAAATP